MTTFRRPNGNWVAQVYDPALGRSRQIGTFTTRKEAKLAEADAIGKARAGGSETVGSFAARWVRDYPRPKQAGESIQPPSAPYALALLNACTTVEARIFLARLVAFLHDRAAA